MSFEEIQRNAISQWDTLINGRETRIYVNTATCSRSAGALQVLESIESNLAKRKVDVRVVEVGCIGLCYLEPTIYIAKSGKPGIFYGNVNPDIAARLIEDYLLGDNPRSDLAFCSIGEGSISGIPRLSDIPAFKSQTRIALHNCGYIDPENIQDYLANKGYTGLNRVVNITPEEVIDELEQSGLEGRGGAGYPTGAKWRSCKNSKGDVKFLVCNANEGDPTAYAVRLLLESDPHIVLEGMVIGAYATRAHKGYIYINADYTLACSRLIAAMQQMRATGLLGENILGSKFSFEIEIRQGAGSFVCGEETALIRSLEGERGIPFTRPPYPASKGLNGKPTIINSVETWANIARIFQEDANWYRGFGLAKSRGTKVFTLAGKIAFPGIIEVPMGITLRQIVNEIGGCIPGGKDLKAVLIGGPTGVCLPVNDMDIQVDYDSLSASGVILGSGSIVVIDSDTCMVELARYLMSIVKSEACGLCVPGREGTMQMLEFLTDITEGRGKSDDIELLLELGEGMKMGSLCGLGKEAPNPVLTGILHFRDEYVAHTNRKRCPARACKALVSFHILPDKCQGCQICMQNCPVSAIAGGSKMIHVIDQQKCIKCGICLNLCPADYEAVTKVSGRIPQTPKEPVPVGSWEAK